MKKEKLADDIFPDFRVVDHFVKLFNSKENRLKPEANNIIFENNGIKQSLPNLLSDAITNYTLAESGLTAIQLLHGKVKNDPLFVDMQLKQFDVVKSWRATLLRYINYAKSHDLIIETECLESKLQKSEQEKEEMKKLIASLEKLCKDLKKENDYLHKHFPDNDRGKTEIGELGKP